MKRIICLVISMILTCGIFSSCKNDDEETKRLIAEYRQGKISAYTEENERYSDYEVDVAFLGDSLTDGYDLKAYYPDYVVAKYNVAKLDEITASEHGYYSSLCADAAAVLAPYMEQEEAKRLWYEEDADNVRTFNVSRFVAKRLLERK